MSSTSCFDNFPRRYPADSTSAVMCVPTSSSIAFGNPAYEHGRASAQAAAYQAANAAQVRGSINAATGVSKPTVAPTIQAAPKRRGFMGEFLSDVRGYFKDNRDLILTIALVLVVDEFVFEGAFRDRIKKLVNGMLKKAQGKLGMSDAAV